MGQRAAYDNATVEQLIERLQTLLANPDSASDLRSEFSPKAVMADIGAMLVSRHKYGLVAEGYPERVSAIGRAEAWDGPETFAVLAGLNSLGSFGKRLRWYFLGEKNPDFGEPGEPEYLIEPGNAEYLVDARNFLMIEFMHPAHPNAHYKATDRDGSPGRVATNALYEGKANQFSNNELLDAGETVIF